MKPPHLLLECRAGFEKECAQEIVAAAQPFGVEGFVKARPDSGFAVFQAHEAAMGAELGEHVDFGRLVFARQMVRVLDLVQDLPEADRVAPLVAAARRLHGPFAALVLEMPDTNDGKALAALTRPLSRHLAAALAKAGISVDDASAPERLQVFFVGGRAAYVGVASIANSSPWPMGIPRIRVSSGAPSRSAAKLAEAMLAFLPGRRFEPGLTAVDLGASPGGWSWHLARAGFMVTAVDNGPIDAALLDGGQVRHRREDGFRYRPPDPVDWMVCDMVESPSRVATLVGRWFAEGWCRESIFNLKLPMKKRWEELERCRAILDEALGGGGYFLRIKHLYHDREEVSAYLARR